MELAKKILYRINNDSSLKEQFYKLSPTLFDVTLRDGIQSMQSMSTSSKLVNFNEIVRKMQPDNIEIGSLVSPKVLPIMSDTPEFYNECMQNIENLNSVEELRSNFIEEIPTPNLYVLIPTRMDKYNKAVKMGIQNISIMSSVSNEFLMKNTNKNMDDTKSMLSSILSCNKMNVKMYLSCINECPIIGKIDNNKVIEEIIYYNKYYKLNEICLSDTCGSLNFNDFKEIIDNSLDYVPSNKISLHLHTNDTNEVEKIINYSLEKNIKKFDVSAFSNKGGCSVTIEDKNKLQPNLTYDLFYDILLKYLINNQKPPPLEPDSGTGSTTNSTPIIDNKLIHNNPNNSPHINDDYEDYEEELIIYA